MRVFEQRNGQAIRIGDEVEIRVIESADGRVRLGIEAPRDVRITAVDDEDERPPTAAGDSEFDTR